PSSLLTSLRSGIVNPPLDLRRSLSFRTHRLRGTNLASDLTRGSLTFPLILSNGHDNLVGPLTLDELVFDEVGFLMESDLFQGSHRGRVARVTSPDDSMQSVLGEGEDEEFFVALARDTETLIVGVQGAAHLTLAVLVVDPSQHEVANNALRVAKFDGHVEDVVLGDPLGLGEATLQRLERLGAIAWFRVEVTIHFLVGANEGEIVEIVELKASHRQTSRQTRLREVNHSYVLVRG